MCQGHEAPRASSQHSVGTDWPLEFTQQDKHVTVAKGTRPVFVIQSLQTNCTPLINVALNTWTACSRVLFMLVLQSKMPLLPISRPRLPFHAGPNVIFSTTPPRVPFCAHIGTFNGLCSLHCTPGLEAVRTGSASDSRPRVRTQAQHRFSRCGWIPGCLDG